jgi:hypothetical protein
MTGHHGVLLYHQEFVALQDVAGHRGVRTGELPGRQRAGSPDSNTKNDPQSHKNTRHHFPPKTDRESHIQDTPHAPRNECPKRAKNIGKRIGIVLNGKPVSAPVVQTAIAGGKIRISGNFSSSEASDLIGKLNGAITKP